MKVVRIGPGRPRKFDRPSRAVTLTLPVDVIAALEATDKDLGHAVVRLTAPLTADLYIQTPAELFKYGDSAVIVVKRTSALDLIPGVTLVPLPDGRALISLDDTLSLSDLEVSLRDLIDETDALDPLQLDFLKAIAKILKEARRTKGILVNRRTIIVLQAESRRRKIVS